MADITGAAKPAIAGYFSNTIAAVGQDYQWYTTGGIARLYNGAAAGDAMAITTTGSVGIGTTSPSHLLDITGATTNNPMLQLTNTSDGTTTYTQMAFQGTGHAHYIGLGNSLETTYGLANKFFIWDFNAAAARVVVDTGGNVGIGTASPGALLEVNGTTKLDSTTTVSGALNLTATVNATGLASGTVVSGKYLGLNSSNQVVLGSGGGGGSSALSGLLAATTTNSIDNVNFAQTWTWNSLTTQTALTLSTSTLTTGNVLSLQNTAAAATATGKVLSIADSTTGAGYGVYSSMSGANNTGYAGYFINSGTAASYGVYATDASTGAGYGVFGTITGAANTGYGGYFSNTATTANYGLYATTSSTGAGFGVAGDMEGNSNTGYAGYFDNTPATNAGVNYGVYAVNNTTAAGYGIYGTMTGAANTGYGIYAANTSVSGVNYAGYFSSATTGAGYGVYATTNSTGAGYGVYGNMNGNSNTGYAGYFDNTPGTNAGVNYAVYAINNTTAAGYGIYSSVTGASNSGYAGYFSNTVTTTGYALYANGSAYFSGTTTFAGGISATALSSGTVVSGKYLGLNSSNQVVLGSGGSGGSSALSGLLAATTTNSIDNVNFAQTWTWNSLSTQTGLTLSSSSALTGGTLLNLQATAASVTSTGKVLSIADSTTGSGYGVYSSMSGSANTGYAGYFTNTATATGYAVYSAAGKNYFANNVGIGNTSPSYALDANGGEVRATDFISTSDRRLKKNIQSIEGLAIVNKLQGVRFDWVSNGKPGVGVIAQDVEAVLPEAVRTDPKTGFKSVEYGNLIGPVIEAVKEQQAEIESLKAANDNLREEVAKLKTSAGRGPPR